MQRGALLNELLDDELLGDAGLACLCLSGSNRKGNKGTYAKLVWRGNRYWWPRMFRVIGGRSQKPNTRAERKLRELLEFVELMDV